MPIIVSAILPLIVPESHPWVGVVVGIATWLVFGANYLMSVCHLDHYGRTGFGRFDLFVVIAPALRGHHSEIQEVPQPRPTTLHSMTAPRVAALRRQVEALTERSTAARPDLTSDERTSSDDGGGALT